MHKTVRKAAATIFVFAVAGVGVAGVGVAEDFDETVAVEAARLVSAMSACSEGDQDRDACEDGFQAACGERHDWTTVGMMLCQAARGAYWERALDWTYARVMAAAEGQATDLHADLRETQRLWVRYRDARCGTYRHFDGSMWRPAAVACMADMTKTRTADLEEAAAAVGLDLAPAVSWRSETAVELDLTCDGTPETVVAGTRAGPHEVAVVIAVQRDGTREPVISLPVDSQRQIGVCGAGVRLEQGPATTAAACPALRIDDGLCDAVFLSREGPEGGYTAERN